MLCALSGGFVVAGSLLEYRAAGSIHGFLSGPGAGGPAALACHGLAMVLGIWFVVPNAVRSVRNLHADMNVLVCLALLGAVGIGQYPEAATVAFLFSLALLLERWSVGRAREAINRLLDLTPPTAMVLDEGTGHFAERPLEGVQAGSVLLVRPGARVPLDGVVVEGASTIDQSPITGESVPVAKHPGDTVYAGTMNQEGAFRLRATGGAGATMLSRIIHLVEQARESRAPAQRWIEQFAAVYTPVVIGLAVAVAVVPPLLFGASWMHWFPQALVILVIACPCALVISTPVSIISALTASARAGVLVKGGAPLEEAARLKAIGFDKTGTLTRGVPVLDSLRSYNGESEDQLLAAVGSLELSSEHPIGRALVAAARARGLSLQNPGSFEAIPGVGARGRIDGREWWVGNDRILPATSTADVGNPAWSEARRAEGCALLHVGRDQELVGQVAVRDALREDVAQAMGKLRAEGVGFLALLTGDSIHSANAVASVVPMDEVRAGLLPEDKVRAMKEMKVRHGHVAMVGDGINDAPAMAEATLGIAMGMRGTDAAIETCDVTLVGDNLSKISWLIRHARFTRRVVIQNVLIALALKVIFIGLALAGAATLWMAIVADLGGTFIVLANSLRLLRPTDQ